jgi:hypothetical protein
MSVMVLYALYCEANVQADLPCCPHSILFILDVAMLASFLAHQFFLLY